MVTRHLMDSLAVAEHIKGRQILDVGSGGGLPGIPLSLVMPDRAFTLLDSNGKKTRFLTQVVINLGLENVRVVQSRVEDFEGQFDVIVSRAFRSIDGIVNSTAHLLADNGSLLAMKGPSETHSEDRSIAQTPGFSQDIRRLHVPGLEAERFVVSMRRTEAGQ